MISKIRPLQQVRGANGLMATSVVDGEMIPSAGIHSYLILISPTLEAFELGYMAKLLLHSEFEVKIREFNQRN
jgi:hypothetical protein